MMGEEGEGLADTGQLVWKKDGFDLVSVKANLVVGEGGQKVICEEDGSVVRRRWR